MALRSAKIGRLLIPLLLGILSGAAPAQTGAENYQKSCELLREKKFNEALAYINKAVKQHPDTARFYFQRAIVQWELKNYQEFVYDIRHCLSLDGNFANAYRARGLRLMWSDKYYEAIKDFNMMISVSTTDTARHFAYIARGECKWHMRDFEGAYADYLIAVKIDSTRPSAYHAIGNVLDNLGQRDEAIRYLLKAYRMDTTNIGILQSVSFQYGVSGNYELAIKYADSVIAKEPQSFGSFNNRGYAKYKLGDLEGAMADINSSLKYNAYNSYAYRNRALVYIQLKKFKKACEDLQKALDYGFTVNYGDEVKKLQERHCD
jgi:tetratricopeptide (TPR) repeat protein